MDEKSIPITKSILERNSLEVCEFCEKTFQNRFESLIHNASHIIIPLLRQRFAQCSKCYVYCVSENELHQHIIVKHPLVIKTERLDFWDDKIGNIHNVTRDRTENDASHNEQSDKIEVNAINFVTLQNEVSSYKNDANLITTNENDASLEIKIETKSITNELKYKKTSVKDFLVFENDDDLENQIDKKLELFAKQPGVVDTQSKIQTKNEMPQMNANGLSDNCKTKLDMNLEYDDVYTPLIIFKNKQMENTNQLNYDVLIQPNKVFCRYCSAVFDTRYNLIIHEQKHMKFKQKILGLLCLHCDKYIAGNYANLTKHIHRKHSKDKYKVYCTSVCKKCGLLYRSYKHHMHNYHSPRCCNLNKFVTDNHFKNHLEKCLCHSHVLSVCRKCYTMLQEDVNFKCVTLGIRKTSGVLQDCKKCDMKVNEIMSVKLSCKIQTKFQYWYVQDRPLNNKDRLKNIRMRLKKLNIMSKMYCFVSFLPFVS